HVLSARRELIGLLVAFDLGPHVIDRADAEPGERRGVGSCGSYALSPVAAVSRWLLLLLSPLLSLRDASAPGRLGSFRCVARRWGSACRFPGRAGPWAASRLLPGRAGR